MDRFSCAIRAVWRVAPLVGLLAWCMGASPSVQAQTLPLAWAISAGGQGRDMGRSIAADAAGNSYVTGIFAYSAVFGAGEAHETIVYKTTDGDTANRYGMFVAKYDPQGRLVWATDAAGGTRTEGWSIAVDGAGNSYVAGGFNGTVTFGVGEAHETTLTSTGTDMFLAKYDGDGRLVWVTRTNVTIDDYALYVAVDGAGNSYVAGKNHSGRFLAKYNHNGQQLWSRQHCLGLCNIYHITVDAAGNSFLIGQVGSSSAQGYFLSVAQYDSDGGLRWVTYAGGAASDTRGHSIATDGVGNSYVTGAFYGTITFGSGEPHETTLVDNGRCCELKHAFVAKYDSNGRLLWVRRSNGTMSAHAGGISVAVDNTGDLSVIGHFSGDVTLGAGEAHETTLHADEWGIFVATYDANGLLRRIQQAEGMGYKSITDVARDGAGHIYMTGEFYGPTRLATFGGDDVYHITLKSHSKHGDIFVAKFGGGPPFVVLADSTVTLDRLGASEGAIWTNGAITFLPSPEDAPSVFTGDLIARKDITMHPVNTLTGTATAQGLVQVLPGATVTGEVLANATVPKRPLPQPTFTADGPDHAVSRHGTLVLEPGAYGQVVMDRDSTLQLRSGAYFLRSLTLGKAAQLVVDVSDGPVQLSVVEALVMGKQVQVRLTPDAADSALFTVTTLQTARLVIEDQAQVAGTLLVPYAAVRLDPESQFTGALIADKVTVQPGAMLRPHSAVRSTP